MSLGLPNFNFIFQSKGVSAIERSARGIVAVILKDDTEGEEQNVYNKVDDVDFTQWTEDNYNYLKLIYEGAPSKVIAMRVATNVESYNAVLKKLKDLKWNYLCIPGIKAADTTMIGAWIKQYRNDEKKVINDYDNKQMFVAAISSYHKELLGDVLDRSYDNTVSVDVDAQRNYLEGRGTDTSEMDDTAVAEANTGSKVFVTSNVKFVDAMEDLKMTVNM